MENHILAESGSLKNFENFFLFEKLRIPKNESVHLCVDECENFQPSAFSRFKKATERKCKIDKDIKMLYPTPVVYWKKVHDFMNKHFKDEPLHLMFRIKMSSETYKDKHEMIYDTLRNNVSVIALNCSTGEIIGVALNGILYEKDLHRPLTYQHEKLGLISKVIVDVNKECDTFKKYDVDEIFECRCLAVHTGYRGLQLGSKLLLKSEEEAKNAGYKLMKTEASSEYTYRILCKLNHTVILEKEYSELLSKEKLGFCIATLPEHTYLRVMVKELN